MSKIFVQIASFNDKELYKTVMDCVNKSSGKNEISFGIHECYIDNKTIFDLDNVSIEYSKAPQNIGVGIGRYIANKLYNNEDYYLQVDSHSRFKENWDLILINDINQYLINDTKSVLSTYPARYWYDGDVEEFDKNEFCSSIKFNYDEKLFYDNRNLTQSGGTPLGEKCTNSISAAFIFSTGDISKVLPHPGIFYWGEELLRAASLYTNGYNLMTPETNVIYHLYGSDSDRKPVWDIYPEESEKLESFSKYVYKTILSENRLGAINMGSERSLEEYGKYIGVSFKDGII